MPDDRTAIARLMAAKKKFGVVKLDSTNPHFKSKYASLGSINDAVDDALMAEGLLPMWELRPREGGVDIEFLVQTEMGIAIKSGAIPFTFTDPQKAGSAITYGKRYTKAALLGLVAEEDDDANATSKPAASRAPTQYNPASTPAPTPDDKPLDTQAEVKKFEHRMATGTKPADDDEMADCDPGFPDEKGKHWKYGPSKAQVGRIYGIAKSRNCDKPTWKAMMSEKYNVSNPYRLHYKSYDEFTAMLDTWEPPREIGQDIPF